MGKISWRLVFQYVRQMGVHYRDDDLAAMSAQISYYLILAFFPFLFFLIHLISFTSLPQRLLIGNFSAILPQETALLSTVGLTAMVMLSFVLIVLGRIVGSAVFGYLGAKSVFYNFWWLLRYGITIGLLMVTFYLVYRYLPNRKVNGEPVLPGAIFATFGWIGASLLFSFYANHFGSYATVYGSLAGLFALIIWIYISTLVFLLGGALNAIGSEMSAEGRHKF